MYKFTSAERARIKLWLEKNHKSEDKGNALNFTTDAGVRVRICRTTKYLPNGVWKVRIAYVEATGYPVLTSSPLLAQQEQKGQTAHVMVPKMPKKAAGKSNKDTFAKALDAEIKAQTAQIKQYLMAPSPIWDWGIKEENVEDGKVTFKIHNDHTKHLAIHKAAKKGVLIELEPEGDTS